MIGLVPIAAAAMQPAAAPATTLLDLAEAGDGGYCLPDRSLCLEIPPSPNPSYQDAPGMLLVSRPASGQSAKAAFDIPYDWGGSQSVELWPHLIAVPPAAEAPPTPNPDYLFGVILRQSAMYSGGGGSGGRLHLFRLGAPSGAVPLANEVLGVVWDSSLMIRACFSEEDMTNRQGACHDEYRFSATLTPIAGAQDAVLPPLAYSAVATASPRTSRRNGDNSRTKLRARDLEPARDPVCSYRRTLRFNPATSRYEMDRPAPDCSEYTTP